MNKTAVLFLLPHCNMKCDYCVVEENYSVMPYKVATDLISDLGERGYASVVLGGGEPTVWPHDVFKLAEFSKKHNLKTQIASNAIHLPEDFAKNPHIDRWNISLDSSLQDIHDSHRHARKGSHFEIIKDRLQKFSQEKKEIYVSTVVTQSNIHSLTQMAYFLNDYNQQSGNLKAWSIFKLLRLGRGPEVHLDRLMVEDEDFENAVREVIQIPRNYKIRVRRNMYEQENVDYYFFRNNEVQRM